MRPVFPPSRPLASAIRLRPGSSRAWRGRGGNVTGASDIASDLSAKRLELLKEAVPALRRVAMLWNAGDLAMTLRYEVSASIAERLGARVQPLGVREPEDFAEAFAAMERERPDAILMVTDTLTNLNRKLVFDFAARHRLPAIYESDALVREGGLMSYGPDRAEILERTAALVSRILAGNKPADLPFELPTRFTFALNLKAARAIGPGGSTVAARQRRRGNRMTRSQRICEPTPAVERAPWAR